MRGIHLTADQIDNLVRAYVQGGRSASAPLCVQYGVNRKYPYFLARKRGLKFEYGVKLGRPRGPSKADDRRWQWAIERGPVCV